MDIEERPKSVEETSPGVLPADAWDSSLVTDPKKKKKKNSSSS